MVKELIKRTYEKRVKTFYEKYERWFIPGFLLVGFIFDVITFRTLQIETTFLILGIYAFISAIVILFIGVYDSLPTPPQNAVARYLRVVVSPITQFTFGALLSSALLFYWFSGSFSASWPIMAPIVLLMTTNEVFRQYYLRPTVQMGVYSFVLFSYFTILFPYLFNSLSAFVFILGGATSLLVIYLLVKALARFSAMTEDKRVRMMTAAIMVFIIMNMLYFSNVIPPIPLSIRDAGVYYELQGANGEYTFVGEEEAFLDRILPGVTIHRNPGEPVYVYTAIFAPAKLKTTIYHDWQYFDPLSKKWVSRDRLSFTIHGGRDEGFRGYTMKTSLQEGKWRVIVETQRGQVLGRIPFTLER